MSTPVSEAGLRRFDHDDAVDAVVRSWSEAGVNPAWHESMKRDVRRKMPLLARALDRLVADR